MCLPKHVYPHMYSCMHEHACRHSLHAHTSAKVKLVNVSIAAVSSIIVCNVLVGFLFFFLVKMEAGEMAHWVRGLAAKTSNQV